MLDNENEFIATEEASDTEELCSVCRDPYTCALDNGPYIKLGCGCGLHHECLVHYIRTKLEDKSSILIFENRSSSNYVKGILCPNHVTGWCKKNPEKYLLPWKDFEDIKSQAADLNIPDSLTDKDMERIQEWIFDEESTVEIKDVEASSDPLIEATTKPCPKCGYRASHAHGHGCHHISPYGGCVSCHMHYCYKCLSSSAENIRVRGGASNCKCRYWSTFCSSLTEKADIDTYLVYDPYPQDARCGCVICSCCKPNRPCAQCPGGCVVCRGILPPAPLSMDEIDAYKVRVQSYRVRGREVQISLFDRLLVECRRGNWIRFQRIVNELPPDTVLPLQQQDNQGRTLLHYACHNSGAGAIRIIRFLIDAGANCVTVDTPPMNYRTGYVRGTSSLEYALSAYSAAAWQAKHRSEVNEYPIDLLLTMLEQRFRQVLPADAMNFNVNSLSFIYWLMKYPAFYTAFIAQFPSKRVILLSSAIEINRWEFAEFVLETILNFNTSVANSIREIEEPSLPILLWISHVAASKFSLPVAKMKAHMINQTIRQWCHHMDAFFIP